MGRRQRYVILGAGSLGRSLAGRLARDGQAVTLVDSEGGRLEGIDGSADLQVLAGSATSLRVLRSAGVGSADVVVALTGEDAANALICGLAKRLGATTTIARVRDPELAAAASEVGLDRIGIDLAISPEGLAVEALQRIATASGCVDALDLADGRVALRAFVVAKESPLAGTTIQEARQLAPGRWLIAALGGAEGWNVPGPQSRLLPGEPAYVCCAAEEVAGLVPIFAPGSRPVQRVAVVGAGAIGEPLAARLAATGLRVLLLESDTAAAERAALDLAAGSVEVLCGAMTDADLVARARIGACDVVVATGASDQDNLMAALLARARGVRRVVAVAHHEPTVKLMASLDLDAVVSPRRLAGAAVQRAVRGRSVAQLSRLSDEHLEFLELQVALGSLATTRPLRRLGLPRGSLVLAQAGADASVAIPGPDTQFAVGDRVVIACGLEHEAAVTRVFA